MRKLDRLLTGGALAIAAHLIFGLGFAVSLEFAVQALQNWRHRVAWVQGRYIRLDESGIRPEDPIPAILPDGSFDPAYTGSIQKLPEFSFWMFEPARTTYGKDPWRQLMSNYFRGWYMPPGSTGQWTWDITTGIHLFDAAGEFHGALTDDGFVQSRDSTSSFNEAIFAYPYLYRPNSEYGILLYATPRGFYRADLNGRTIARLTAFSGEPVALYWGGPRDPGSRVPRVYVVTPSSVFWCDTDRTGAFGSFDLPESMRSLHDYEVAVGSDGRVIVRASVEKALTPGISKLKTAVFKADGRLVDSYAYEINSDDRIGLYASAGEQTGHELGVTVAGKLVQATMPPAWRLPLDPAEAFISPGDFAFRRGWIKTIGGLWMALILSGVAAALVAWRARRRGAGWPATLAWAAAVVALGIPMALAAYFIVRPARHETCAGCGARQSAASASCRRCGAAIPGPARLGIEIR